MTDEPLALDVSSPQALARSFWDHRKSFRSQMFRCDCRHERQGRPLRAFAGIFTLPDGNSILWVADKDGERAAFLIATDAPPAVAYPHGGLVRAPRCGCAWLLALHPNESGDLDITARRADGFTADAVVTD